MSQGRMEQVGTPEEVYDKPANSFVYSFLGNVNLFHSRLDAGYFRTEDSPTSTAPNTAVGYARPYELELERHLGNGGIETNVSHTYGVGPLVKVDLKRNDTGELLQAEVSRRWYREMALKPGDTVYVRPRNIRVFAEDYSI
jgi:sulfate transport system ATP-binding protein